MAKYNLSNEAVDDLTNIQDYTFEKWTEKQTDTYYKMLLENCQLIADNPNIGKNYDEIKDEFFGLIANKHIIFLSKV